MVMLVSLYIFASWSCASMPLVKNNTIPNLNLNLDYVNTEGQQHGNRFHIMTPWWVQTGASQRNHPPQFPIFVLNLLINPIHFLNVNVKPWDSARVGGSWKGLFSQWPLSVLYTNQPVSFITLIVCCWTRLSLETSVFIDKQSDWHVSWLKSRNVPAVTDHTLAVNSHVWLFLSFKSTFFSSV